jgi:hypothetical protein
VLFILYLAVIVPRDRRLVRDPLTGRYPPGMFDFVEGVIRWHNGVVGYAFLGHGGGGMLVSLARFIQCVTVSVVNFYPLASPALVGDAFFTYSRVKFQESAKMV